MTTPHKNIYPPRPIFPASHIPHVSRGFQLENQDTLDIWKWSVKPVPGIGSQRILWLRKSYLGHDMDPGNSRIHTGLPVGKPVGQLLTDPSHHTFCIVASLGSQISLVGTCGEYPWVPMSFLLPFLTPGVSILVAVYWIYIVIIFNLVSDSHTHLYIMK